MGSRRTLSADTSWPAPGSKFEVELAGGAQDHTEVLALDPGRRIQLHAGARVFGPAKVTIALKESAGGTEVTLVEDPDGKFAPLRLVPPVHLAIKLRNVESLRRFKQLVLDRG